ncbi:Spindle and kinetochore-associated protein 1-like protein, partial [Mucuna pruriens]
MNGKEAGASLDSLMSSFNARISQLQELPSFAHEFVVYPASSVADLSAVDAAVSAMELQVKAIKNRLLEEAQAIPKTKARSSHALFFTVYCFESVKLIDASLRQQKKLQNMSLHVPSQMADRVAVLFPEFSGQVSGSFEALKLDEEPAAVPKEKKGRGSPPTWFVTGSELDSLSSYMRGRLTLEKVNAAVNDMASYAEANAQLIVTPKKKLAENLWEKALEIRDIATMEGIKGKHFFLEADIKGPSLKLDNTGKAILTVSILVSNMIGSFYNCYFCDLRKLFLQEEKEVLRHLGRISETRVGHHRVIILQKPH